MPNGWGWVSALDVPGRISHPYDPATVFGALLHLASEAAGLPVDSAAAVHVSRQLGLVGGALAVLVLLWLTTERAALRSGTALVGGALVVVALAAPTVHALVRGLGPEPGRRWREPARPVVDGCLSVVVCFSAPPDPLAHRAPGVALLAGLVLASLTCVVVAAIGRLPLPFRRWTGDAAWIDRRGEAVT